MDARVPVLSGNKLCSVIQNHELRTPSEDINQRNLKIWTDVADKICFGRAVEIWDWEWILGHAVKAIFSLVVRSPCTKLFIRNINFERSFVS
jgi:hypothetical protein